MSEPTTAVLLIAHGSRHPPANEDLHQLAARLAATGDHPIVEPPFLELAEPDIAVGGDRCVARGAACVLMVPYFLSEGVHLTRDLTAARRSATESPPGSRIPPRAAAWPRSLARSDRRRADQTHGASMSLCCRYRLAGRSASQIHGRLDLRLRRARRMTMPRPRRDRVDGSGTARTLSVPSTGVNAIGCPFTSERSVPTPMWRLRSPSAAAPSTE